MSPAQRTQIQARLAAVAAERAKLPAAFNHPLSVTAPTLKKAKQADVKRVAKAILQQPGAASVTPASVTANAARQAKHRQAKGAAGKKADAARKRAARAKKGA